MEFGYEAPKEDPGSDGQQHQQPVLGVVGVEFGYEAPKDDSTGAHAGRDAASTLSARCHVPAASC